MTTDFISLLPLEERRTVLKQRIQQLAAEGYQHQLNREGAQRNGKQDLILEAEQKIIEIGNVIQIYQRDLNALPPEQG
jgi:hypothetical protein